MIQLEKKALEFSILIPYSIEFFVASKLCYFLHDLEMYNRPYCRYGRE